MMRTLNTLARAIAMLLPAIGFGQQAPAGKRILVLCTGNSARSQMTEGFLRSFGPALQVFPAGTNPAPRINPFAVQAMKEVGIDISAGVPKGVNQFTGDSFDYAITVCGRRR